ncbi:MAG: hypothetical protein FJX76_16995 [Armatimonadetes bacterium]|nr:hypothetical protein [Armatimonadota bacterium]
MDAASFAAGVIVGAAHFFLFLRAMSRALSLEVRGGFLMVALLFRHLLLGIAYFALWKGLGMQPFYLAGGIVLAYALLRMRLTLGRSG